ncbi:hypothetical protein [Phragmitibacter flavus]|uniref:hypothetical protein n=1 Tax=Phragmitibacter flavus TaxID=2576071 RepID=UPI0010FE0301|nr:hypothetical protein [Phragmitibacter flavus]
MDKLKRSLQQFQLGDGGGPAYLIAWNRDGILACDLGMKTLVDLWFAEEKEHSRLLGDALKRFDVEEIHTHWSFELFCGLRKYLGVQFELSALLLTEIVSHVYYKMLRKHCEDEAVRGMCQLIIRDETGHIAFHRARLAHEATTNGRQPGYFWEGLFRMRGLMAGTVLWINHRSALIALGATDAEFYRAIWRDMDLFIKGLHDDAAKVPKPQRKLPAHRQMVAQPRH